MHCWRDVAIGRQFGYNLNKSNKRTKHAIPFPQSVKWSCLFTRKITKIPLPLANIHPPFPAPHIGYGVISSQGVTAISTTNILHQPSPKTFVWFCNISECFDFVENKKTLLQIIPFPQSSRSTVNSKYLKFEWLHTKRGWYIWEVVIRLIFIWTGIVVILLNFWHRKT